MFGLPILTSYSAPVAGEVVGTDPFDDVDDATYARGSAGGGFHHITSVIDPTVVDGDVVFVFRVSATKEFEAGTARFTANLYPPGWESGDPTTAILNFTAGPEPVYVTLPLGDGTIEDIPVTINDWDTEEPATAEQIVDYFAAGGTLLIQPSTSGAGVVEVTVHRVYILGTETTTYRRIFPRDDRRNWPRPKGRQAGRIGGGYL